MSLILQENYRFVLRFYRLATVNILSNLMIPLSSLVSVAFLGHLEDVSYLTGVLLSTILFNLTYSLLAFLRMSTTGLTAQALGQDDQEAMLLVGLRNGIIALGLSILILTLQYPFRELGFSLLSATPEVKASGIAYFNARIWGVPAVLLNFVLIGWFLGREQSGKVLLLSAIGNMSNIVLDYLFIVRQGWQATGAGISQASSQYLILLLGMILASKQIHWKDILSVAQRLLDLPAFKFTFSLNGNIFVKTLAIISGLAIFNVLSSRMGTTIFAENALIVQIIVLAFYFFEGLGYATETLTGIFKGQQANDKLKFLVQIAGGTGVLLGLTFAVWCILFPRTVFGLLTNHDEVIEFIDIYIPWLLIILTFYSISIILDGYFIGLTEGLILRNVALIAFGVGFAPVALIATYFHNNHMLWLALSCFMVIRAVALLVHLPRTLHTDWGKSSEHDMSSNLMSESLAAKPLQK
ncbi:MATE family efflux transporter [Plectonema radiosum NIES-515]|uniref:MATE family efflux transporter n=1 Tax=Plectonema radiosum NIES-515 TaxID=2986073 RepID=A0ABT3B3J2_9CYAN|nr:guanitoxin biosynthesis MATE family efflux transporter GntT [Plectonema radiosum]MCV3215939.1 MATE family efflux transporter [Plectonema radiosum NIES-515]